MMRALAYLDSLSASGDTQSAAGVSAALGFPHAEQRLRLVTFLTDGYVGNEAEILSTIYSKLGASRIFSFGIGSSVNRYLLERMAKIGRGAVAYVSLDDEVADAAVEAFYERISHPALSDIHVDFGNMQVSEVYPSRVPDLFVGRPVILTGKLRGRVGKNLKLRGRVRGIPSTQTIPIDRKHTRKHPALAKLWARMKIADLTDQAVQASDVAPLTRQIAKIALYHGIVSSFTSFVAVDTTTHGEHGTPRRVDVAVPMPDGVSQDAIDE
jgi:Ca-activated chloride channel family protein